MCNRRRRSHHHRIETLEPRRLLAVAIWDGGGADSNWSTAANWVGDVAPQPGDALHFTGDSRINTVNDFPVGTSFQALSTSRAFHLAGNGVRLAAGITAVSTSLALPIILEADQAVVATGNMSLYGPVDTNGHRLTLAGTAEDSASYNLEGMIGGTGALVLEGPFTSGYFATSNTHSGGTTVRGGNWTSATGVQSAGAGRLTVAGGSFELNGPVAAGATLTGGTITVAGAGVAQGSVSGGLSLAAPGTLAMDLTGPFPGGYDQLNADGPVSLGGATLRLADNYPGVRPVHALTLLNNTGAAPVSGQFNGLPEGASLTVNDDVFRISYAGGDGNDVTLTYLRTIRTWDGGGANNNWSTPGNWVGDVVPQPGDELHFAGNVRTSTFNDLPSAAYHSITTSGNFTLNGNFIFLSSGLTAGGGNTTINLWLALTDDQVFSGTGVTTLTSPIETHGRVLTLRGTFHVDNVVSGPGAVVVDGGAADVVYFEANNTHTGGTTVRGGTLWTTDDQSSAGPITVTGGTLRAVARLPAVRVEAGVFTPGGDAPTAVTIWPTVMGPPPASGLWVSNPGKLRIDLDGPTAGGGYDQVRVFGDVRLYDATLELEATYAGATAGQVFTIIRNEGSSPVDGAFAGLPEGETVRSGAYLFRISYAGGDGNDVTLTYLRAIRTWDGGGTDANWSTPANWVGDVAPSPGDELNFAGSLRKTTHNDFPADTPFHALSASDGFRLEGNRVRLTAGVTATGTVLDLPLLLEADQAITGTRLMWVYGPIDTNGHALTVAGSAEYKFESLVSGSGWLVLGSRGGTGGGYIGASNTYTGGTFVLGGAWNTADSGHPTGTGWLSIGGGSFLATAPLPSGVSVSGGSLRPGGSAAVRLAVSGALSLSGYDGGTLDMDVTGPAPGSGGHDQIETNGPVGLGDSTLRIATNYPGISPGQTFTLINNRGAAAVTGQFRHLPEGATFVADRAAYRVSYAGGDGNDVTVTYVGPGATWDGGGGDDNWTTPQNWIGDVAPSPGDALSFPLTATAPEYPVADTAVNDFPAGTPFHFISVSSRFTLSGNRIRLLDGVSVSTFEGAGFMMPITLAADQTFRHYQSSADFTALDTDGRLLSLRGRGSIFLSNVTGAGGLDIDMPVLGQVMLNRGSPFSGGTTVRSGDFYAYGDNDSVTPTGTGPVTLLDGVFVMNSTVAGHLTIGGGVLHLWRRGSSAPAPVLRAAGGLTVTGGRVGFAVEGPVAGVGHEQIAVTGPVTLTGGTLEYRGPYVPRPGDSFVLVSNDGTDPVSGTFAGMPEGTTFAGPNDTVLRISYAGGDGNDVVVSYVRSVRTWTGGGADDRWTNPLNWAGGVAPRPGDELHFGSGATLVHNDFPAGTEFASIVVRGSGGSATSIRGNPLRLSGGLTAAPGTNLHVALHITLAANQSFVVDSTTAHWDGGIDTNGHTLALTGSAVFELDGIIAGPGALDLRAAGGSLGGWNTYSGGTAVHSGDWSLIASSPGNSAFGTGPVTLHGGSVEPRQRTTLHAGLEYGAAATHRVSIFNPLIRSAADTELEVTGGVVLGGARLELMDSDAEARPGQSFMIIRNDGTEPISGQFHDLPDGATLTSDGAEYRIDYDGGDGNDVTLTRTGPATIEFLTTSYGFYEGTTTRIAVTRTGGTGPVSFSYTTSDDTAVAGVDYIAASGTMTIPEGARLTLIEVPLLADRVQGETEDRFTVTLGNLTNAVSRGATAIPVQILDAEPESVITFAAVRYEVAEAGPTAAVTIHRTGSTGSTVNVTFDLFAGGSLVGQATPGEDFADMSGSVTFAQGETVKTVHVPILDDAVSEGNEEILINFRSITGSAVAASPNSTRLVILDDDSPGVFSLGAFEYRANEADGSVAVTVHRGGTLAGTVGFSYSLSSGLTTAEVVERPAGVATDGVDFEGVGGTVTMAEGQTTATFTVRLLNDRVVEGEEIISVRLQDLTGGATFATPDDQNSRIVVADDDAPGGPSGPFSLGPDPTRLAELALFARGTDGPDHFRFAPHRGGLVAAFLNGRLRGVFAPPSRLIVQGFGGNDRISSSGLRIPLRAYGGEGDDVIAGSPLGDALHGGGGNDRIAGGRGRDLLIGGGGSDRFSGGADEDLLVAGATSYDSSHEQTDSAAVSIASVWTGPGDYAARTEFVRLADSMLLSPDAVLDDGAPDVLRGQAAADCFFTGSSDRVVQRSPAETVVPGPPFPGRGVRR